ncbi:Dethiobiotin synthetase [Chelatococcus sambhunathii]|uniref:ATP-dependent dethiobiotin synthetase BioD n=1 Tax=Chelatococcus sambhunathii TaxID=363953 RepID=A0ABP2AAY3_9HYPH|nr:ATP-dependent dethiobiotin synthetase BioD [Chelatococcus sambhunathii]CUA90020.1 Dethiobiotin synthetase [Chelatococcus sambhunathii]
MSGFIVTGTDTGIGKTVFCAALVGALGGFYWKPVQAGLDGETDSETVRRLSGLQDSHVLLEAYRLALPASPHRAAEAEGVVIDVGSRPPTHTIGRESTIAPSPRRRREEGDPGAPGSVASSRDLGALTLPTVAGPLVVEGAGGPMVPLTRGTLFIDVFAAWGLPVILCAATRLGTINHALLALEALKRRHIPVHGVAFIGEPNEDSEAIIAEFGVVRRLGRLPLLPLLTRETLASAFAAGFDPADFR